MNSRVGVQRGTAATQLKPFAEFEISCRRKIPQNHYREEGQSYGPYSKSKTADRKIKILPLLTSKVKYLPPRVLIPLDSTRLDFLLRSRVFLHQYLSLILFLPVFAQIGSFNYIILLNVLFSPQSRADIQRTQISIVYLRVSGSNLPPSTFPFSFLFLLIPWISLLLPQVTYLLNFIPTFCPTPTPCIDPPTSPPILYPLTLRSSFLFPYPLPLLGPFSIFPPPVSLQIPPNKSSLSSSDLHSFFLLKQNPDCVGKEFQAKLPLVTFGS